MCDNWAKLFSQPQVAFDALPSHKQRKLSAHRAFAAASNTAVPENRRLVDAVCFCGHMHPLKHLHLFVQNEDLMDCGLDIIGKIGFNREFNALSGHSPFRGCLSTFVCCFTLGTEAGAVLTKHADQRISRLRILRFLDFPMRRQVNAALCTMFVVYLFTVVPSAVS